MPSFGTPTSNLLSLTAVGAVPKEPMQLTRNLHKCGGPKVALFCIGAELYEEACTMQYRSEKRKEKAEKQINRGPSACSAHSGSAASVRPRGCVATVSPPSNGIRWRPLVGFHRQRRSIRYRFVPSRARHLRHVLFSRQKSFFRLSPCVL